MMYKQKYDLRTKVDRKLCSQCWLTVRALTMVYNDLLFLVCASRLYLIMKSRRSSSSSSSSNPPSSLHYDGSRPPQAQAQSQSTGGGGSGGGVGGATTSRRRRRTTQQQFVPTLDTIPSNKVASNVNVNRTKKNNRQPSVSSSSKHHHQKNSKSKPKTKRKRYRRVKRLKPCVPRAIFLVPLVILAFERYIGQVIHLEDATTAVYDQVGIDPFAIIIDEVDDNYDGYDTTATRTTLTPNTLPSLTNITHTPRFKCHSREQKRILNIHNPYSHSRFVDSKINNQTIPKIIHQHGPTRCLTLTLDRAAVQWAGGVKRWSYYYWDDDAVDRLLGMLASSDNRNLLHLPEFPLLKAAIMTSKCYDDNHHRSSKTSSAPSWTSSSSPTLLSEQLWQYLTLWLYGGMYVDLAYRPTGFNCTTMIHDTDHGIFFFEDNDPNIADFSSTTTNTISSATNSPPQEQQPPLSSKFMAVTPKHPLMYLTIQHMLRKILLIGSSNRPRKPNGEMTSSPSGNIAQSALNEAWEDYKEGFLLPKKQLRTNSKTRLRHQQQLDGHRLEKNDVRTVGTMGRYNDELISSVFQTELEQQEEYEKLFEQKKKLQQQQQQHGQDQDQDQDHKGAPATTKSFGGGGKDCHLLGLLHGTTNNNGKGGGELR